MAGDESPSAERIRRAAHPVFDAPLATALLAAALALAPALWRSLKPLRLPTRRRWRRSILLMSIAPLPDVVQGSTTAPATIIEYASLTCSHCAAFHEMIWPQVKAKYVDAGLAKFILREFPLDPLATAAFMLARCAGPDKRNLLIDQLFLRQTDWAFVDKPIAPLIAIAKGAGLSEGDSDACLKNQELYEKVNQSRDRAAEAFNIDATPTFFINGRKLVGEIALSDFDRWLSSPAAK